MNTKSDKGSFKDYSYYYDLFYRDKDYKGEALLVDQALKKHGRDIQSILSFGCGTGRYERELEKVGYHIHGIDMSEEMISVAMNSSEYNEESITYEVADIRDYHSGEKYDAVISLFQVMSYQTTNDDMENALKCAREHLNKGGLFVFDVWYGPGVLTDPPVVRHKRINDGNSIIDRIASPIMYDKENVVDVHYTVLVDNGNNPVKRFDEIHKMRYWFRPEIVYISNKVGFELVNNYDSSFKESGYESWTSYFVLKAI